MYQDNDRCRLRSEGNRRSAPQASTVRHTTPTPSRLAGRARFRWRRHADNENQSAEAEISGMKSGARERRLLILHRDILVRFQSQKLNNADLVFIDLCRVLRGRYRAAETRLRG